MMFSERLEHGKYDFQHLQGTVRVQKPVQFRGFSEYYCEVDRFRRYAFRGFFCVCRDFQKYFSPRKKKLFWKNIFLVAARGLLYLCLNLEGNRRRSDLSQRNIGTSRNWSKMSPECSNPDGSNHVFHRTKFRTHANWNSFESGCLQPILACTGS